MDVLTHTMLGIDRILNGSSKGPQQPMPGNPALVEGPSPTAGIRTADAGTPPIRFWTVRFERAGRTYYDRVEAPDACMAGRVALLRNVGATSSQTVHEISRAEYDRFTRRSP